MLIGAPAVVASYGDAWVTPYISQTCKILTPNSEVEVLGCAVGGPGLATALFGQALHKACEAHDAIALVNDVATELVLTRSCADACKVNHLLRTNAPEVSCEQLQAYDGLMRRSLERILGGPLDDLAFAQAATGVRDSGLGFRLASARCLARGEPSRCARTCLGLRSGRFAAGHGPRSF